MSESVLPIFFSRSFIVSGLTFRSLLHFEFILCMVLESAEVLARAIRAEKEMQKSKCFSDEALQITKKRREAKGKGKKKDIPI